VAAKRQSANNRSPATNTGFAARLTNSPLRRPFFLLEAGYEALMEGGNILDRRDIAHVKAITENTMEHKLKAQPRPSRTSGSPVERPIQIASFDA
jgi:hypothetical protein